LAHQYRGQLGDTQADETKDATLSAFTKVIFRVTEPDSRALGSLFVDLEERRRPTNLAIEVLDKLERHPSPVVKEFTAKYVWPLQAGAKDRVGTRKRFIWRRWGERDTPLRGDEDELRGEMSYERWCEYMLWHDGILWNRQTCWTNPEFLRVYKRVTNPREGFDYAVGPDYPKRDFGAGEVTFNPAWAQEALQVLNLLLYEAQKSGRGCAPIDDAETRLSPAQYRQYQENLNKAQKLDGLLGLILRFDDWADAAAAVETDEQYRQLLQDTVQGKQPRNVIESCHRLFTWRAELQAVVEALVREPISQGASDIRPADVARSLQRLPSRQAYIRIGTVAQVLKTHDMAPGVGADEARERWRQLREQTRRQLCRRVAPIRRQPDGGGGIPDVQPPADPAARPAPQQDAAPADDAPRLRRFRPLP
jgi:hypothetical protein